MANTQGINGSELPFINTIERYMTPINVDGKSLEQHVTTHFNTFHGLLCVRLATFDKKFDAILQKQLATDDRVADFENNVRKSYILLEDKIKQVIQAQAAELEVSLLNGPQSQNERSTGYLIDKDDLSSYEGTVRGANGYAVSLKALQEEFAASSKCYRTNLYDNELSDDEENDGEGDEDKDQKIEFGPAALFALWIRLLSFGITAGTVVFLVSKLTPNY